jgi:cell division protein FtsQ
MWDNPRQLNAVAIVVAAAALAMLLVAAAAWAVRQPALAIREVVIQGDLVRANPAHLEAVVREELRGGFFTLTLADARASLESVPWVREASVRRSWPLRLEVTVSEHQPFARWNDNALVDVQGDTFVADYDGELPQFFGPDGHSVEFTARFREFARTLEPVGLNLISARLTERGTWELGTAGAAAIKLQLGRVDPAARLARFVDFYPSTMARLQRAGMRADRVDLRYRNGFAVRVPGLDAATKPGAKRSSKAQG